MKAKQLKVSAINNGTVIDHISPRQLFKVIEILGLENVQTPITFGTNLESVKLGRKALIKISDYYFEDDDINRIALIAPDAKINIIHNYKVVEKRSLTVPDEIRGIARCFNPRCITNHYDIETRFTTLKENGELSFLCHYCEKVTLKENLQIISKNRS